MNNPRPFTPNQNRATFVAFEGIDGSGKTTQAHMLKDHLSNRGIEVVLTCEPTSGPIGRAIRQAAVSPDPMSPEEETDLFIQDRADHVKNLILPALRLKQVVITDRYYLSTMAYQGARGLEPAAIRTKNELFAPSPDLTLLIDIPPAIALQRIQARGRHLEKFEMLDFLIRVRDIYLTQLTLGFPGLVLIDGRQEPAVIHQQVTNLVERLFGPGERSD
ncbi:MAG: dTMP kinase [Deltaproteobacteria bacterium]|nr:dTMP kinase [Deltaproteobacteria bacterium]